MMTWQWKTVEGVKIARGEAEGNFLPRDCFFAMSSFPEGFHHKTEIPETVLEEKRVEGKVFLMFEKKEKRQHERRILFLAQNTPPLDQ